MGTQSDLDNQVATFVRDTTLLPKPLIDTDDGIRRMGTQSDLDNQVATFVRDTTLLPKLFIDTDDGIRRMGTQSDLDNQVATFVRDTTLLPKPIITKVTHNYKGEFSKHPQGSETPANHRTIDTHSGTQLHNLTRHDRHLL